MYLEIRNKVKVFS